jgi:hypothetical protein
LALLGYYAAPKKLRHLMLTIFSYIFYGWANPWFCLLMLFNTSVDLHERPPDAGISGAEEGLGGLLKSYRKVKKAA